MAESISSLSESLSSVNMPSSPPLLGPGEVLKPSGKFAKPTKIPGKKYCKDEVVIRNADSGKGKLYFVNILVIEFFSLIFFESSLQARV